MSKKLLAILMSVLLLCTTVPLGAVSISAAKYENLYYEIKNGKVTITGCNYSSSEYVIPETIEGYPVTSIDNSAFYMCDNLTSVNIPDSVTSIGRYAFAYSGLTSLTIPESVTVIGESAFCYCSGLTSLTIPDSVTSIGDYAFECCKNLTSVTISNNITNISSGAFWHCESLTSVTIPDSVTSISHGAFECCYSLSSVTIPDSVTSIGGFSFYWCESLTSVTIPDSVSSIGSYAFNACSSLAIIIFESRTTEIYDDAYTISSTATIYGYAGSTAEAYATKYGRTFYCIDEKVLALRDEIEVLKDKCVELEAEIAAKNYLMSEHSSKCKNSACELGEHISRYNYICAAFSDFKSQINTLDAEICELEKAEEMDVQKMDELTTEIDWLKDRYTPSSEIDADLAALEADIHELRCHLIVDETVLKLRDKIDALKDKCVELESRFAAINVSMSEHSSKCDNSACALEECVSDYVRACAEFDYFKSQVNTLDAEVCELEKAEKIDVQKMDELNTDIEWLIDNYAGGEVIDTYLAALETDIYELRCHLTSVVIPDGVTYIGYADYKDGTGITSVTIPDSVTSIDVDAFWGCSALTDVYYNGSEADRANISIGSGNDYLLNATWHYAVCDHEYVGTVTTPADCVNTGVMTYTCADCGDSYTEELAALGHNYEAIVFAPDCYFEGFTQHICATCGDSYITDETAAGHNYETVVTVPDCENAGYTTHTCSVCGDTFTEGFVEPLGHTYNSDLDADCNVCGQVRVVYGDVTKDGKINNRDLGILQQHLNGYNVTLELNAADIYFDGKINNKDLGLLQLYLNGRVDTLGPTKPVIPNEPIYTDLTIVASEVEGKAGETVSVQINLKNNPGIVSLKIGLGYDASALELVDREYGPFNGGGYSFGVKNNPFVVNWCYAIGQNCKEENLITLQFKIKEDAVAGEYPLELFILDPEDVYNKDFNSIGFTVTNGSVTVTPCEHVYVGTVTTPADCVNTGVMTYTCSDCGDTYTEKLPASGNHTYDSDLDADCNVCGDVRVISGTTGACTWTLDGTHLTISGNGKMADYDYYNPAPWGTAITSVTIEDSVTSIGKRAFSECYSLTSVTIGDSVTSIGDYAFVFCTNLTSVSIPDGVTSIGDYAFEYCTNLTSVTIPDSVTSIGDDVFFECHALTSITIPDSVTSIGDYAFCSCRSLASITIPDSVTSIGLGAFEYCTNLTSVTIPSNVTSIAAYAFAHSGLTSLTIPDSVTYIGGDAFYGCNSLTSVTIPDSVTAIDWSAFYDCYSLTDVYYNGSKADRATIYIGGDNEELLNATWHYAVCSHEYVGTVTTPADCVNTGVMTYTCSDCGDSYTEELAATGNHFYDSDLDAKCNVCGLTRVISGTTGACTWTLDGTHLTISGNGAMNNYGDYYSNPRPTPWGTSITSVTIEYGVTYIGGSAFAGCTSLTSISIPDSVATIGSYAFAKCTSLTSITIPDSVATISNYAFSGCHSLTSVNIGNGVDYIDERAFSNCDSLTSVTIPNSAASIGNYAFYSCDSLISVIINGVYFIGESAFGWCTSLASVTIGDSFSNIDISDYAFEGCESLTSVSIGSGFNYIGYRAFYGCDSLSSVTIPDTITYIEAEAFLGCYSLTDVYYGGSKADCEYIFIAGHDNDYLRYATWHFAICYHSYIGTVTTPADCVNTGVRTYTCSDCGDSHTQVLPALGHNHNAAVTAPDCVNGGFTTYTCSLCGDSYVADYTDALGHIYQDFIAYPNCVNGGYTVYHCVNCGDTYESDYTDALGHTAGADADCTNPQVCTICGEVLNAALGHSYDAVVTPPDCYSYGSVYYTCSVCGDTYFSHWIDPLEHYYVLTELLGATCTEDGYAWYVCDYCGDTFKEELPALGHTYDNACDSDCNDCGAVRVAPHTYVNACDRDCNICGVVRIAPHVYDGDCDSACNLCGTKRQPTADHVYTDDCDATCNLCGAVRTDLGHVYTDSCDHDCNHCGALREPPHHYTDKYDATCDTCGAWREIVIVYGDADGDDKITTMDAVLLSQYLAGWDVTLDAISGDADGDGAITTMDAVLLSQYLAGWNVQLG